MNRNSGIIHITIVVVLMMVNPVTTVAQSLIDELSNIDTEIEKLETNLFLTSRISNGQSLETANSGELLMLIQHRFGNISNGFYDFFGLDLATMRLGFEYGLNDYISVAIGRSTFEKTYDLGVKGQIMKQSASGNPLSLSVFAGSSISTIKNLYPVESDSFSDRSTYVGMIMIGRKLGRFSLQLSPILIYNGFDYRVSNSINYGALGIGASVKITKRINLSSEYFYGLSEPGFDNYNPLSIGMDIDTGGHVFQLIFSNSTGMFEKSLLTNNVGNWTDGEIYFGFNLIRTFYLK